MNDISCVAQAYVLMREGNLMAALQLLEADVSLHPENLERDTLRYLLYRQTGQNQAALSVTEVCLTLPLPDLVRSTWLLRQGLALLELKRKSEAARAFHAVLSIPHQKDHHRQAREALLRLTHLEA